MAVTLADHSRVQVFMVAASSWSALFLVSRVYAKRELHHVREGTLGGGHGAGVGKPGMTHHRAVCVCVLLKLACSQFRLHEGRVATW